MIDTPHHGEKRPGDKEAMKKSAAIDTTGAVVGTGTGVAIGAKIGAGVGIAAGGTAFAGTLPLAVAVGLIGLPVGLFGAFVVKTVRKRLDERKNDNHTRP